MWWVQIVKTGKNMGHNKKLFTYGIGLMMLTLLTLEGCNKPEDPKPACSNCSEDDGTISGVYAPVDYVLILPDWMPSPNIPEDNPLTEAGVALGRQLFYDPILSADSSQSCSSCHIQSLAFTDGEQVSTGIRGLTGRRNAMSLVNLGYNARGFFWDGRSLSLEEQALDPIEDHLEMDNTWEEVEKDLRAHPEYPQRFRSAFGIDNKDQLTRDLVVKAIAQFERTLISYQSRYDNVIWERQGFPTDSEQRGIELFFIEENQSVAHPGCSHCHFNPHFTDHGFKNNGLDSVASLEAFNDLGRGGANNNIFDNGKFRVPSLRNVALTAPYMHDGRFNTLEEVLESYALGGHGVINEDPNIRPFSLSERDKQDLLNFLHMLTDSSFIDNPAFSNPFE